MTSYPSKKHKVNKEGRVYISKSSGKAVREEFEHCLCMDVPFAYCYDSDWYIETEVCFVNPSIVRIADGTSADKFDFYNAELYLPENKNLCKLCHKEFLEETVAKRCLPGTVIKSSTIHLLSFCFEVCKNNNPAGCDLNTWAFSNIAWVSDVFGWDNIVLAVVHGEEDVPHMHILVTPIVNGKFCGSAFGSRRRLKKSVEDSYFETLEEHGVPTKLVYKAF